MAWRDVIASSIVIGSLPSLPQPTIIITLPLPSLLPILHEGYQQGRRERFSRYLKLSPALSAPHGDVGREAILQQGQCLLYPDGVVLLILPHLPRYVSAKKAPVARFLDHQTWNPTLETFFSRHSERLHTALSVYTRGIGIKIPRKSENQLPTSSVLNSTINFSACSTPASTKALNAAR